MQQIGTNFSNVFESINNILTITLIALRLHQNIPTIFDFPCTLSQKLNRENLNYVRIITTLFLQTRLKDDFHELQIKFERERERERELIYTKLCSSSSRSHNLPKDLILILPAKINTLSPDVVIAI